MLNPQISCMHLWKSYHETLENQHIKPSHLPGECSLIDRMESTTPGLIAQLKVAPTKLRYRDLIMIVDHHSIYTYFHLHSTITSGETLKAKLSFEALSAPLDVSMNITTLKIEGLRKKILKDIEKKGQKMSYCGVNTHFQNGIAERIIRDLQERARPMINCAMNHWPEAVDKCRWNYTIRFTCNID
jgi:hypothetical protein